MRRSRVRRAAKLKLGLGAKITGERVEGWPVVSYKGHRLAYRVHTVDGRYFRLVVPCSDCGADVASRAHHIRGRRDLEDAVIAWEAQPAVCRSCQTRGRPVVDLSDDLEWPDAPVHKRKRPLKSKR